MIGKGRERGKLDVFERSDFVKKGGDAWQVRGFVLILPCHEDGRKSYDFMCRGGFPLRVDGCRFRFHIHYHHDDNPSGGLICHIIHPYICMYTLPAQAAGAWNVVFLYV